ncbi:MAG: hypothetical protein ACE141_19465 [Bryobacteraceae bacterium]
MQFILTGFDQEAQFRSYAFMGIENRTRVKFTVGVDLALIPRYGIRMQELPLLCRRLLDRRGEADETRALTFTEEEMSVHASSCAVARAAAAVKRKPWRRPPDMQIGAAWRGPQQH